MPRRRVVRADAGWLLLPALLIIEPPDLWDRYIDAPFKHQAPRGFAEWVLDLRIEIDGKLMPANVAYSGTARGQSAQRDRERFRPFHDRGWDAAAQLEAMDEDGVDVGVIYPTRGLFAQGIEWLGDVYARELTMEPSDYFKRQCFVSVECDEDPVKAGVELMGAPTIVFSTDFPHPDCKYPGAVTRFLELPLSDDVKRAILGQHGALLRTRLKDAV